MAEQAVASPGFSLGRLWNDKEARAVLIQILTMVLLAAFLAYIVSNAIANLEAIGKTFSFGFLSEPASYDINQHLIPYTSRSTHLRAAVVGLLNTLLVAACGIVLTTLLGFTLGVLRLSSNWLVNRMAYCWIEMTRNVPVLLHILLIHGIIVTSLPRPKQAIDVGSTFFLSNRGFFVPSPQFEPAFWAVAIAFVAAIGFAVVFSKYARKVQDETGKHYPVLWINLAAIVLLPAIVYFIAGRPMTWQFPELKGFNYQGGMVLRPEFLALWLALSYYTSSFIAEIVRAGILSVSYGQTEAAYALGLRPNRTLSLIIIPQALRVIVPPLASQYMNLTKNSSLAIAIGYMDLVATIGGISLMQTGKEMETMIIVLLTYLVLSLSISAFMNWYNQRIKLVER
jgi:general L-amino acid transport system permease protein